MPAASLKPAAILLAAGFSTRMRAFKPLLPLTKDLTPLRALCAMYTELGIPVLVVSGHRADEVEEEAARLQARTVRNPHPETGMFSSVLAGLSALPAKCTHVFVHPVDMPMTRPLTPLFLLRAAGKEPARTYVPSFQGRMGHPPLLSGAAIEHIRTWPGENGLRGAMDNLPPPLAPCPLPVPDRFCLLDMDTPENLDSIRALWPQRGYLTPIEALELLRIHGVPDKGLAHAQSVGGVAAAWAQRLGALHPDCPVDAELAHSGGLLHDLCKGLPRHAQAAAMYLRELRLPSLARLVEAHHDLALPEDAPVTERELVCLADKYVHGAKPVALEERFAAKLAQYAGDAEACAAIHGRLEQAQAMEARIGALLGGPPARFAAEALNDAKAEKPAHCTSHKHN